MFNKLIFPFPSFPNFNTMAKSEIDESDESIWDSLDEPIHEKIFSYLTNELPILKLVNKSMNQRFKDVDTKQNRSYVLRCQTLWDYAEQHFIRCHPKHQKPPLQFFLTSSTVIQSDSLLGDFKPQIPLSLPILIKFIDLGRIDLLDHYIENDDALFLTMEQRLTKFPFDYVSFYHQLMEFVVHICFKQCNIDVLDWLLKHIDIFFHIMAKRNDCVVQNMELSDASGELFIVLTFDSNVYSRIVSSSSLRMLHQRLGDAFVIGCGTFFSEIDLQTIDDISFVSALGLNPGFSLYSQFFLDSLESDSIVNASTFEQTYQKFLHLYDDLLQERNKNRWYNAVNIEFLWKAISLGSIKLLQYLEKCGVNLIKTYSQSCHDWKGIKYAKSHIFSWLIQKCYNNIESFQIPVLQIFSLFKQSDTRLFLIEQLPPLPTQSSLFWIKFFDNITFEHFCFIYTNPSAKEKFAIKDVNDLWIDKFIQVHPHLKMHLMYYLCMLTHNFTKESVDWKDLLRPFCHKGVDLEPMIYFLIKYFKISFVDNWILSDFPHLFSQSIQIYALSIICNLCDPSITDEQINQFLLNNFTSKDAYNAFKALRPIKPMEILELNTIIDVSLMIQLRKDGFTFHHSLIHRMVDFLSDRQMLHLLPMFYEANESNVQQMLKCLHQKYDASFALDAKSWFCQFIKKSNLDQKIE